MLNIFLVDIFLSHIIDILIMVMIRSEGVIISILLSEIYMYAQCALQLIL